MPNPLFNALGGQMNPAMQQFAQFMRQMQGRDPKQMLDEIMSSGKISQQQLNQVQQQAQQMRGVLDGMRGMFGF